MALYIGGKNTQEEEKIRIWAAPTAGPEISTVLGGILEKWVDCCDSQWGEGLWQQWLKKNTFYSYVLTCSVDSFGFPLFCFSCQFYWLYEI